MIRSKVDSYMGFASRARKLATGYNTALMLISKGRAKLIIVAGDLSENTIKKITDKCKSSTIEYRIFSTVDYLGSITGAYGKGIYAITDSHFASILMNEIDIIQSEKEDF